MILIKMDPATDYQSFNQRLFMPSTFGKSIPKELSQLGNGHGAGHHQVARMNVLSGSKMIIGWESKATTDAFRSSTMSSDFVDERKLPIAATNSAGVPERNQFSPITSLPHVRRMNKSTRSSDVMVAPRATSSASEPSSSSVSSDNHDVSSSKKSYDGTIRVPSGSGYRIMTPFPWRLHEILDEVEQKKLDHIVSWLPDGQAFQVHCQDSFSDVIIPMFFRHSRYKSFQRQLYLYGFRSMETHSMTRGAYFHPKFRRDDRTLCRHIVRVKADNPSGASEGSKTMQGNKKKRMKESEKNCLVKHDQKSDLAIQNDSPDVQNQKMANTLDIRQPGLGQNSGRQAINFSGKLLMFSDEIIDLFRE